MPPDPRRHVVVGGPEPIFTHVRGMHCAKRGRRQNAQPGLRVRNRRVGARGSGRLEVQTRRLKKSQVNGPAARLSAEVWGTFTLELA